MKANEFVKEVDVSNFSIRFCKELEFIMPDGDVVYLNKVEAEELIKVLVEFINENPH